MSEDNSMQQPANIDFVLSIAQTLEARIDHNFNSLMSISFLVEFLYSSLEKRGIEIPLDEEFEKFQKERLKEIREQFEQAAKETNEEMVKEAAEDIIENSNINLDD